MACAWPGNGTRQGSTERNRRTTGFVFPLALSMGHGLGDPHTSRQARAAGQHAKPRSKACVCRLRQSGLRPQLRGRQQFSRRLTYGDLQPRMHALHRARSPRLRLGAVLLTSWLIGRPVRSSTEITLDCRVSMLQRSMLPHSSSIARHSRRELWWIWLGHLSPRCCIP